MHSTLLGNDGDTSGYALASADPRAVYVAGSTSSVQFPGAPPLAPNPTAGFVSKFSFDLSRLEYTKLLGADAFGVAVRIRAIRPRSGNLCCRRPLHCRPEPGRFCSKTARGSDLLPAGQLLETGPGDQHRRRHGRQQSVWSRLVERRLAVSLPATALGRPRRPERVLDSEPMDTRSISKCRIGNHSKHADRAGLAQRALDLRTGTRNRFVSHQKRLAAQRIPQHRKRSAYSWPHSAGLV